jgi:hypothetical protein
LSNPVFARDLSSEESSILWVNVCEIKGRLATSLQSGLDPFCRIIGILEAVGFPKVLSSSIDGLWWFNLELFLVTTWTALLSSSIDSLQWSNIISIELLSEFSAEYIVSTSIPFNGGSYSALILTDCWASERRFWPVSISLGALFHLIIFSFPLV